MNLSDLFFFQLSAKSNKKLTYMYLANDVLQNGKRKGPEFINEFKGIMPSAFRHCVL